MTAIGQGSAERIAIRFVGAKECVLHDGACGVDWHHLDENRRNWVAWNIVGICPAANREIELSRNDRFHPLRLVGPLALQDRARDLFGQGRFRESFWVARLNSVLRRRAGSASASLLLAARALTSLRSSPEVPFLRDTLRRAVCKPLSETAASGNFDRFSRWVMTKEIESWLREYGHFELSKRVGRSPAATPPDRPHGIETEGLVLAQVSDESRAAHLRGTQERDPSVARPILQHALVVADQDGFAFGVTNAMVSLAQIALAEGRLTEAADWLARAVHFCGGLDRLMDTRPGRSGLRRISWWMAAELFGVMAEIDRLGGNRSRSAECARRAIEIHQALRIQPRAGTLTPAMRSALQTLPPWFVPSERRPEDLDEMLPVIDRAVALLGNDLAA